MGKSKKLKFEEAFEQLEVIIDRIESGQTGLEDSLTQYEQGMKLLGQCRTILDAAQKRIAVLTADARGGLQVKDDDDA